MTDLRKLSEAATPGEWTAARPWVGSDDFEEGVWISAPDDCGTHSIASVRYGCDEAVALGSVEANAAFIVALVNAYRSGSLIPRSEYEHLLELLAEAREALAHISYREIENTRRNPDWPRRIARAAISRIDGALAAEPEAKA